MQVNNVIRLPWQQNYYNSIDPVEHNFLLFNLALI